MRTKVIPANQAASLVNGASFPRSQILGTTVGSFAGVSLGPDQAVQEVKALIEAKLAGEALEARWKNVKPEERGPLKPPEERAN
jgi:hypothetical protein